MRTCRLNLYKHKLSVMQLVMISYSNVRCHVSSFEIPRAEVPMLRPADELKTAPQQGEALELSFHCFPWLI